MKTNKEGRFRQAQREMLDQQFQMSTEIELYADDIEDEDAAYIAILQTQPIQQINLSDNPLTYVGIGFLSNANWKNLNSLHLDYNNIGVKGGKYLSKFNCCQLEYIFLAGTDLGSEGISHFVKAQWRKIKCIDISKVILTMSSTGRIEKGNWKQLKTLMINLTANDFVHYQNLCTNEWSQFQQINVQALPQGQKWRSLLKAKHAQLKIYEN